MKQLFLIPLLILQLCSIGQTKRVLFIGNSYTYYNNLPMLVSQVASSAGDSIEFKSNTPGGYTYNNHTQDATTLSLISEGNWDFVVLQEQSQLPSFPIQQVETECFPYAHILDSLIIHHNPCAETVFYMTWGRKNGDASNCASWPPVCTYVGMDSLLKARYTQMANENQGIISPVSTVWRYLRNNAPSIELYAGDESHPSLAGSYAAACSFYAVIFRKDPTSITFNSSLTSEQAQTIKNATKLIVYDSLQNWNIGKYDPIANFNYQINGQSVSFTNTSLRVENSYWDFGDGNISTETNPTHTFLEANSYNVKLIVENCFTTDTLSQVVEITTNDINNILESNLSIYPNPCSETLNVEIPNNNIESTLVVVNSIGKMVYKCHTENKQEITIQTKEWTPGVYFLILTNSDLLQKRMLHFVKTN